MAKADKWFEMLCPRPQHLVVWVAFSLAVGFLAGKLL